MKILLKNIGIRFSELLPSGGCCGIMEIYEKNAKKKGANDHE